MGYLAIFTEKKRFQYLIINMVWRILKIHNIYQMNSFLNFDKRVKGKNRCKIRTRDLQNASLSFNWLNYWATSQFLLKFFFQIKILNEKSFSWYISKGNTSHNDMSHSPLTSSDATNPSSSSTRKNDKSK